MHDVTAVDLDLRARIESFLYHECDLLDGCAYEQWLELFDEDGGYSVPSTDSPHAERGQALFLIDDDYERLSGRVTRLMSRDAHADYPHPRTRRFISNVRIDRGADDDLLRVKANFLIYSLRVGHVFQFMGGYRYVLRVADGDFKIKHRRAELDLESLDFAGGKINVII